MFKSLLIANRGEIACRVMRTAQTMGIRCIAVYSAADKHAPHVLMADEAYYIGPAPARESYLNTEKILEVAKQTGADAIHPGYGFLSENAEFALLCEKAGIIFVGPPAAAITAMGSKSRAKQLMEKAKVPLIPGYYGADQSTAAFIQAANKIGYPVLLKASAGGGGKGMRVVTHADEMETALAAAKREALSSFSDDDILLEKYLAKPRHVEIQVFSDKHDHHIYLYERDCSIQRRHQKIIEEAPAPGIAQTLREAMGAAAVACAKAINYVGAGTIEFLLDEDGQFYFMEMNTRLQVEHPITEMITGLDLVAWQLMVAANLPLPLQQNEIPLTGHAIEVRIYAEDPAHDFLPSIGRIDYLQQPETQAWLRIDTGVICGSMISQYYDPMIAKLIVWGSTREEAIARLTQALQNYHVGGVKTNLSLLTTILTNPAYLAADIITHFITLHQAELFAQLEVTEDMLIAAAIWQDRQQQILLQNTAKKEQLTNTPWFIGINWRMNMPARSEIVLLVHEQRRVVNLIQNKNGSYQVNLNDKNFDVAVIQHETAHLRLAINHIQHNYTIMANEQQLTLFKLSQQAVISIEKNSWDVEHAHKGSGHLRAPMPGTVTAILIKPQQVVTRGMGLMIIEAMKMEHTITAPQDGTIQEICYQVGDNVDEGTELIVMEA